MNYFSQSASYQTCEIITIPAKYDPMHVAIAYQKDSPYNGLFDYYLREMREKGSLKQILNKYEIGTQFCPDESGKPLGLESCFTAFLALLAGNLYSNDSFITDYFHHRHGLGSSNIIFGESHLQ